MRDGSAWWNPTIEYPHKGPPGCKPTGFVFFIDYISPYNGASSMCVGGLSCGLEDAMSKLPTYNDASQGGGRVKPTRHKIKHDYTLRRGRPEEKALDKVSIEQMDTFYAFYAKEDQRREKQSRPDKLADFGRWLDGKPAISAKSASRKANYAYVDKIEPHERLGANAESLGIGYEGIEPFEIPNVNQPLPEDLQRLQNWLDEQASQEEIMDPDWDPQEVISFTEMRYLESWRVSAKKEVEIAPIEIYRRKGEGESITARLPEYIDKKYWFEAILNQCL